MIQREIQGKVEAKAAKMASVVSGSTGSLVSSGSSTGTNEDCVINEDHFSSSCSSLELEDIQEAIEGVGSCLKASHFSAQNIPWDLRGLEVSIHPGASNHS